MHCRLIVAALLFAAPAFAQDREDAPLLAAAEGDGDPGLVAKIGPLLTADALDGVRYGVYVARADGGEALFSRNADAQLHPASNTKLVTTAAALHTLGPAHLFHTDLVADRYDDGTADVLYFVGGGDPFFVSESLWKLVDDAKDEGLRRVRKGIVIDESYFGPKHMAPGFDDKPDDDASYRAATGAASLNFNSIVVRIEPGAVGKPVKVSTRPGGGYAIIDNEALTTEGGKERVSLTAKGEKGRTRLTLRGRMPKKHRGLTVRRRIDNPPLFLGLALKEALEDAGIKVGGKVRIGTAPEKTRRLARHWSPALGKLVDDVNKLSNNFMAEHLLRAMGAERNGGGGWDQGQPVVNAFLEKEVGIRGFTYRNGSGLFGDTAFSPRQMGQILQYMHTRRPALPEYAASLAIGGTDGTLRRRFKHSKLGQVRAKTGTLAGVTCLSGYVEFADGSTGVFSLLFNDVKVRPWKIWRIQDRIVEALMGYRPPPG